MKEESRLKSYVNAKAIDCKLLPIQLVMNSPKSIRVKLMKESEARLSTHKMIISNANDEEMSDKKA